MSINSVNLSAHNRKIQHHKKTEDDLNPVEQTLLNSVAPVRRLSGLPDMVKQGDGIAAAGLAALTVVSLPEDCRDVRDACKHSSCLIRRKKFAAPYDFGKYQHDFSFFRGTLLHEVMKRLKSERGKQLIDKIYRADKTIYHTKFGTLIKKCLEIEDGRLIKSKIKNLYGKEIPVQEMIIKKDFLGLKDLTGRAMKRTSLLGVAFMGALELPKLIKSIHKDDNGKSFGIQGAKSALNVLGLTIGMGYLGALGGKKFGALGSLLGMGLGVLTGVSGAKWLQNKLFKD